MRRKVYGWNHFTCAYGEARNESPNVRENDSRCVGIDKAMTLFIGHFLIDPKLSNRIKLKVKCIFRCYFYIHDDLK